MTHIAFSYRNVNSIEHRASAVFALFCPHFFYKNIVFPARLNSYCISSSTDFRLKILLGICLADYRRYGDFSIFECIWCLVK